MASHPVWVRGLKLGSVGSSCSPKKVAPRVGAWIETASRGDLFGTRVWSHPVWVRGLKHLVCATLTAYHQSHPVWVRGLKPLL